MTWANDREFALVAACVIWPHSEKRIAAIKGAAQADMDWDKLFRVARRQRVEGLVHDGLTRIGIVPSPPVQAKLQRRANNIARRNAAMAAESLRLQKLFDQAGIVNLILKGATLSVLAYGNPFVKSAWDIDLLVGPDDVGRSIAALKSDGYVRTDPKELTDAQFEIYLALARECIFSKDRVSVEIKWRLSDNPELLKDVSICSGSQQVPLGDGQFIRTLGRDELFSYLCVHGASHCWARLKWIADLGALLDRESLEERERLYRNARARGAGPCAAQALLLCQRLLGTELPAALAAELDSDWRARWLAASAMFAMRAGESDAAINRRPLVQISTAFSHFLMGQGWQFFMAEARNKWVSLHDHVHVPLPRWAHFLYPLIRLPLFLWRRLCDTG